MANENFTQLPSVVNATLADIFAVVQSNQTQQETAQQLLSLFSTNIIASFAGNPNGNVAGVIYNFCWDTTDSVLYVCTSSGSTVTAVWTAVAQAAATVTNPAHGGTGVANPSAHSIPVAEGSSNFTFKSLTNGQLLIGSSGADPVAATISAGGGISISNGAGSIQISSSGGGTAWVDVTTTPQPMSSNTGYIADRVAGNVVFSLPTTAVIGDTIVVVGRQNGWSITQAAGQQMIVGSSSTTVGVGGSLASTNAHDCITLICTAANTEFTAVAVQGVLTIV